MDFPYIKQIKVNDCYAHQDFKVFETPAESFKHIIFTGRNGSGKTTVLDNIEYLISVCRNDGKKIDSLIKQREKWLKREDPFTKKQQPRHKKELESLTKLELDFFSSETYHTYLFNQQENYLFTYCKYNRKSQFSIVNTVTKDDNIVNKKDSDREGFSSQLKQYLVNKKVQEAFDLLNNKKDSVHGAFFEKLTTIFKRIFKEKGLYLEFVQEEFEFYIHLNAKQKVTLNQLPAGFSALISILMDLLVRVDVIRKAKKDFSFDPPGIVLIDEPETHLHLEIQYEVLPLLTELFPKLQFIVATHSPAVISSLENAHIFDISSQKSIDNRVLGSSYSELMIRHFGLKNEYGPIADQLFKELYEIQETQDDKALQALLQKYDSYLTAGLRFEIESKLIEMQARKA